MQKIVTNLWFDGRVEEALEFYTSVFPHSKINSIIRYGEGGPRPKGEILVADFELEGQQFAIINGGPDFSHSPAVSLAIKCEDQAEVDRYWDRLCGGGTPDQCGWLTDRYGISWQVVPVALERMLQEGDDEQHQRVTEALLKMVKLDLATLERAYRGE